MNVQQIQAARNALEAQLTALVWGFETDTGCIVHSIPVTPARQPSIPTQVTVKVQIP